MENIEIVITIFTIVIGAGMSAFGYFYNRNENNKDLKFEILSDELKTSTENQRKILNVVNDMKVQLAKVEAKTYTNFSELSSVKKEISINFKNINDRLNRQDAFVMQNKENIAVVKSVQTNCSLKFKNSKK